MKVIWKNTCIPTELMAELREAADKLTRGERDPEAAKKAAQRMDRMREENRKLRDTVKSLETRLAAGGSAWEAEREEVRRRVEALTARLEGLTGV